MGLPQQDTRHPGSGTPRLVQDFVTAPRPLTAILPRMVDEPSTLPTMVERAAGRGNGDPERTDDEATTAVAVLSARDRHDGWSAHVTWSDFLGGVPPFDGEIVVLGADPHRTWIALEGTVTLASHAAWSEAPLRLARLEIRTFLQHLAEAVTSLPDP